MRLIILLSLALGLVIVFLNPGGLIKWFESDQENIDSLNLEQRVDTKTDSEKRLKEKQFENELAQQMSVLAKRYEENIRFPNYSIPINEGQTDLLEPLQVRPVSLNIDPEATSHASLAPDSYVFFQGEPIKATLSTTGDVTAENVKIILVENNEKLASFSVQKNESGFEAVLEKTEVEWSVDLHIRADFRFGEYGNVSILSPIKYSPDNGAITSVGSAYIDTVNLAVPVNLSINQAGRYRLSANLFDQNNRPLAHLNAKQNLKEGDNTWILNVHSEVLRASNQSGPYWVDTWQLTKLPERPGISTSFGKSEVGKTKVNGFPLSEYDDSPWQDPKDQARLEFLKKLQD